MIEQQFREAMDRMVGMGGADRVFESLGIYDHDGVRDFVLEYALSIVDGVMIPQGRTKREHMLEHIAAAVGAGILLGLDHNQREKVI